MNTALSWIKAYVPDLDVTAQEYTDAMTLTGTKVEGYSCLDKNLENIVVGEVLSVERHPDADKLVVCQVNVGAGEWGKRFPWSWTGDAWQAATMAGPFLRTASRLRKAN